VLARLLHESSVIHEDALSIRSLAKEELFPEWAPEKAIVSGIAVWLAPDRDASRAVLAFAALVLENDGALRCRKDKLELRQVAAACFNNLAGLAAKEQGEDLLGGGFANGILAGDSRTALGV